MRKEAIKIGGIDWGGPSSSSFFFIFFFLLISSSSSLLPFFFFQGWFFLLLLPSPSLLLLPSPISVESIIVSFGYDEVRFHKPVRPGDTLTLGIECTDKRASRSRPEAGIITFQLSLTNQQDELALSHLDTVLIRRRAAE